VPAAAVRRVPQALSGLTGRKGSVGGFVSPALNLWAQPVSRAGNGKTREYERLTEPVV